MMGRQVLITAGGANIGLAIAQAFAKAGDHVAICDVDRQALAKVPEGIAAYAADVANPAAITALIEQIGPVDILVNNAGVAGPAGKIEETSVAEWERCFAVNVHGAFHAIRAVVPAMREAQRGVILNISTASTQTGIPGRSAYVASKWALEGMTRNLARELGPDGVRVNAIRPGFMDTSRMQDIMARVAAERNLPVAAVEAEALGYISMRTKIQPTEIAEMACFLASEAALHVTGQIIGVDGNAEWEG